jgi:rhamnulokinase
MSRFYVACDLTEESGRVVLGTLHRDALTVSEVRRFRNEPLQEKHSLYWNIPQLYEEILESLRSVGSYEEPVASISCSSWAGDYLLVEGNGTLIMPTYHHQDPRAKGVMKAVFSKLPREAVYNETGIQSAPRNTLFQLEAETSRRLRRAGHLLPVADGFNYLLAGVARVEMSQASATQLFNPVTKTWSEELLRTLRLPAKLLPPVVPAGTELGELDAKIAKETRLEEARVISSCSNELAAALVGLPITPGETWAFLRPGMETLVGTQLTGPLINDLTRELGLNNEQGYGQAVTVYKRTVGLWILEECQRYWRATDRELDTDLLTHLAGSATPFESLIAPDDPRFREPGDMPLKIQAFCKETNQEVPRKPGPIFRCILESLALHYRRVLREMEQITGSEFNRLYILQGAANSLLNHFTANALQVPAVMVPEGAAAIGNILVQAVTLRHVQSLEHARATVRNSVKMESITPVAAAWDAAYERLLCLREQSVEQNAAA